MLLTGAKPISFWSFWMHRLCPTNVKVQGTSIPPCGESTERRHLPVTWHKIVPFRLRKK